MQYQNLKSPFQQISMITDREKHAELAKLVDLDLLDEALNGIGHKSEIFGPEGIELMAVTSLRLMISNKFDIADAYHEFSTFLKIFTAKYDIDAAIVVCGYFFTAMCEFHILRKAEVKLQQLKQQTGLSNHEKTDGTTDGQEGKWWE